MQFAQEMKNDNTKRNK